MKTKEFGINSKRLECIRVFGSVARGDADSKSDLDILAIIPGNRKPPEESLRDFIIHRFSREGSITCYSCNRMQELFKQGHLFAWHVFLESKQIVPEEGSDVLKYLGEPSRYTKADKDMALLIEILSSVKKATMKSPRNVVYEAGLIYVCTKNIALIASSFGTGKLDFSRYSPYHIIISSLEFSIPRRDYDLLIEARHASMRGFVSPKLYVNDILKLQAAAFTWAKMARAYFQEA